MDLYIGKTLDNRYEILEMVGTGGMALVYKAMDHRLNRLVAVKVLKSDLAQNADFRKRFHDEAQAVAMLSHPNIMSVYDVSYDGEAEYMVMELIDGITLKQYMERRGQLNWREALHFISQIIKGLGHAHSRGIIHRDIKPHNIMILRDGSVKVADFGIACLIASAENTLTQEALGSVHYISPEQAKGGHTDARTDIYSSGVVLYEMLTNRLPFEGETAVSIAIQHISSVPLSPRELNPEIPEALELITMKAMAPDIEKRYITAEQMLHDLDEFRKNPSINFDYVLSDFAVDESSEPTMNINTKEIQEQHDQRGKSAQREERRSSTYDREYDDYDDRRRNGQSGHKKSSAPIVAGIIVAILVIAGLFAAIFSGFGESKYQEYVVPGLLGMTLEEVLENPEIADSFEIEISGNVYSDEYDVGQIVEQTPEGGRTKKGLVDEKHLIVVVISAGVETDQMQDLLDLNQRTAEAILRNMDLGLSIRIEEEFSDEYEAGNICRTEPAEKESLKKGDTVTLYISKGPEIKNVTVIDYEGMDIEQARNQLGGLMYGGATEVESELPKGQIISQSLKPTTEVKEGTQITFVISAGIQEPELVSVTRTFELPEGEGTVHVEIIVGNETQFDSTVDKSLTAVSCTLTGIGLQHVYVKFDGVLVLSEEVDFS